MPAPHSTSAARIALSKPCLCLTRKKRWLQALLLLQFCHISTESNDYSPNISIQKRVDEGKALLVQCRKQIEVLDRPLYGGPSTSAASSESDMRCDRAENVRTHL